MKHLTLLFLLLLINEYLLSQVKFKPKIVIPMIVSGAADGIDENIKFHKVGQRHSFQDMRTSWQRKWKNGCIEQGERLRGSSTLLVAFTDRYHLMRFVRNTSMLVSFTFSLCSYDKNKKWTYYLVNAIVNMLAYKAGFVITYYLID